MNLSTSTTARLLAEGKKHIAMKKELKIDAVVSDPAEYMLTAIQEQ